MNYMNFPRLSTDSQHPLQLMLASAATLAEVVVFFHAYAGLWAQALLLHVLTCLVLAWAVGWLHRKNTPNMAMLLLLPVCIAFTGLFGALLCLVAASALVCMKTLSADALFAELMPDEARQESVRLYERIAFGRNDIGGTGVEPLQDVLASGSMLQKQAAIVSITRWFRPQFASLLRLASRDTDAAVRVQAATAIANLERGYMLQYLQLKEKGGAIENQEALADLCYDFALSGMADAETQRQLYHDGVSIYRAILVQAEQAGLEAKRVRMRLARLYLQQKQADSAKQVLLPLMENTTDAELTSLYLEALFQMKDYAQLRKIAAKSWSDTSNTQGQKDLQDQLLLWAQDQPLRTEAAHAA